MANKSPQSHNLFILDTNVLMQDPAAIFRFQEHDVFLPLVVLEELDAGKNGTSETARNVREASRILDELICSANGDWVETGVPLENGQGAVGGGRLYFQTRSNPHELPDPLPGHSADNDILNTAVALRRDRANSKVVIVSKDINLRIKARVLGIPAEDYFVDKVLDDVDLLYSGVARVSVEDIAEVVDLDSAQNEPDSRWIRSPAADGWCPNQCLYCEERSLEALVREVGKGKVRIQIARNYAEGGESVWGIHARNREQGFALNLLMDADIDFVSLLGTAGTGKTLLALAAGLAQTLDNRRYREIVMTRVTVPVGDDIGFLPGTEEEKMTPWMGALMDNLEVLTESDVGGDWGRAATQDLLQNRIKIRSMNFMRGRTFLNRYVILDEAQNLTKKQMKTLITRAGPGTKIICLGNIGQIDTPYLTETTSGLTYAVDAFKSWPHSAHVTLVRGERSRLADFAAEML
ncbi:MAG: PhoH family protein [Gammaproteobacteria bacterium]|nr:PhoH family protein [Gammaproteobacteria bacterium]